MTAPSGPYIPRLETERLIVRRFEPGDLDDIHRILDVELAGADFGTEGPSAREQRAEWLRWSILNYEQLERLYQPPYGDRAIVLREGGELVGACGCVPSLGPFAQLAPDTTTPQRFTPEIGLYYAVSTRHQRRGYAVEAVRALVDALFALNLDRIIAMTTHDNAASIAVMQKLGMTVRRNPLPEPPWFQVVGVLEHA